VLPNKPEVRWFAPPDELRLQTVKASRRAESRRARLERPRERVFAKPREAAARDAFARTRAGVAPILIAYR